MLQNNYDALDYKVLKQNYNLNMINFANTQTKFISLIPEQINKISRLTDKLSNITIIGGNTYYSKPGNKFEVIESINVDFNNDLNILKLAPSLVYKLEPKENLNKLISNKKIKIFDLDKTKLKVVDDLFIRGETINIFTEENNFNYTFNINFNELTQINNFSLKLNDKTLSYPNISEVYFINNKREKIYIKILNNNKLSYNLDTNRAKNNLFSVDLETFTADNINIVFQDNLSELIIDKFEINYLEYNEEGLITFKVLMEDKPIIKIGLTADETINECDYSVSYDGKEWYKIDLSNIYGIDKKNKVIAFNTISDKSIKTENEVKNLFLKVKLKALQSLYNNDAKIDKNIFKNSTFNVNNINFTSYSLYENEDSIYYGKETLTNIFNYMDLYNNGEYLIENNSYFIKGFKDSPISKVSTSSYKYTAVTLKSKEKRLSRENLFFDKIDISTKELFSFKIDKVYKSIINDIGSKYVLPLKDEIPNSIYYLKQNNKEIKIDLTLGFINSAIDVLYAVEKDTKVFLLDSFKNLISEINSFELDIDGVSVSVVSLLDLEMFETIENLSRTYPITFLNDYEVGLFHNKIESISKDKELNLYDLVTYKLYTKDNISVNNKNYAVIESVEDYNRTIKSFNEVINKNTNSIKLTKGSIIKGTLTIEDV